MRTRTFLISLLVLAGLTCGIAIDALAQGGGGGAFGGGGGAAGGRGGGRGGILTADQTTKINEAVQADLTALTTKLTDAQKAAVTAALAKDAIEASVKTKIEAVVKIQVEIAMLKYTKGIKPIISTITDEQKTQLDASTNAYNQLFGTTGAGGRQRGAGGPGGAGGAGGFGGGGAGGAGGFGGAGGGRRGAPGGN